MCIRDSCDSRFNREVKKTKLPTELPNHDEIMARINDWREKYYRLLRNGLKHSDSHKHQSTEPKLVSPKDNGKYAIEEPNSTYIYFPSNMSPVDLV